MKYVTSITPVVLSLVALTFSVLAYIDVRTTALPPTGELVTLILKDGTSITSYIAFISDKEDNNKDRPDRIIKYEGLALLLAPQLHRTSDSKWSLDSRPRQIDVSRLNDWFYGAPMDMPEELSEMEP